MTSRLLDAAIREYVEKDKAVRLAFGIQSTTPWTGPDEIDIKGVPVRVAQCRSMLEMREHLGRWDHTARLALVTPIDRLSDDLRARLYKQKLLSANAWDAVLQQLRARSVDVRLGSDVVLAEAMLDCLADAQPSPPTSGVVIEETVWDTILPIKLGLVSRIDPVDVITWLVHPNTPAMWAALSDIIRTRVEDWLRRRGGPFFDALLGCLRSGFQADAVAIGLALQPLLESAPSDVHLELMRALGRMERFTSNVGLTPETAKSWFSAAEQVFRSKPLPDTVDRLDRILDSVQASRWAYLSKYSAVGTKQALDRFAESPSEDQLQDLENRHWFSDRPILERLAMMLRLQRWLENPDPTWVDFADMAQWYRAEGSWVDWARSRLRILSDSGPLNLAIASLVDRTRQRRESQNRAFGALLAEWTREGSPETSVIGVESIIDRCVKPIVNDHPVLLVVMDGMGWAITRELFSELIIRRWGLWSTQARESLVAASVLPSVTQYSRSSLLCGALRSGTQSTEVTGFENHPGLKRPILFHKSDLTPATEDVLNEIANPERRVVGVVINAIDDELSGSKQISPDWTLEYLSVLRGLLVEAATAGGVVILTSDHGHTLDTGTTYLKQDGKSDRWRLGSPVGPDEQYITGSRVLANKDGFVGLAVESGRYSTKPKNGYHGGLTPQECLVPVLVLSQPGVRLKGWEQIVPEPPVWWVPPTGSVPPKQKPTPRQPYLFTSSRDWIDELLESGTFKSQIALAGGKVQAKNVAQVVRVLVDAGERLLKPAFAQRMNIPLMRVPTVVAAASRVLNVDGYAVIELDEVSQTVKLDRDLLLKQFDLA